MAHALQWIRDHDDRLSFVALYVGGAIALSVWLNLFWVAMLMLGHFVLEIVRGHLLGAKKPFLHALWEVKLDIALVLFALVVALYSEMVFGLLGLGQAARAGQAVRGVQAATRFGVIERAVRVALLTADDAFRLVQAGLKLRNRSAGRAAPAAAPIPAADTSTEETIGTGDIISLAFGAVCVLLILLAPQLTGATPEAVTSQILEEISPHR